MEVDFLLPAIPRAEGNPLNLAVRGRVSVDERVKGQREAIQPAVNGLPARGGEVKSLIDLARVRRLKVMREDDTGDGDVLRPSKCSQQLK